jgi:phosphoribosylanthranilate isomerase
MDAKICGIKDTKTLNYIVNHNNPPKFVGFITNYPKSRRYVGHENLKKLINIDKKKINFVSVLVSPNDEILEKIKDLNFDYYQLYDVSPKKTKIIKEKYKVKIITALTIENKNDVEEYKEFESISEIELNFLYFSTSFLFSIVSAVIIFTLYFSFIVLVFSGLTSYS